MHNSKLSWPGVNCIAVLLIGLGTGCSSQSQNAFQAVPQKIDRRDIPILSSFTYNVIENGELVNVLEAESMSVNPRRMLFFNIKNVNELALTDVKFDVYLREDKPANTDPFSVMEGYITVSEDEEGGQEWPKQFGLITRQVVKNLVQNIYQGGDLIFVVEADTVYIDVKTGVTEYLNTRLKDGRSDRTIVCKKATWDKKQSVFKIPGPYLLSALDHKQRGNAITVNYDFIIGAL